MTRCISISGGEMDKAGWQRTQVVLKQGWECYHCRGIDPDCFCCHGEGDGTPVMGFAFKKDNFCLVSFSDYFFTAECRKESEEENIYRQAGLLDIPHQFYNGSV